jgi:hypothetical protein
LVSTARIGVFREHKTLKMEKPKCWNCGEDCFEDLEGQENHAVVQIHYLVEKKQVCCDCYHILRELDGLSGE